ncbi:unnamed protein product [Amoebophrya sp. A25]|nr:unnamed protein product [Amoebophrya sp. A25]|eukprot:GSA25T00012060001.1
MPQTPLDVPTPRHPGGDALGGWKLTSSAGHHAKHDQEYRFTEPSPAEDRIQTPQEPRVALF